MVYTIHNFHFHLANPHTFFNLLGHLNLFLVNFSNRLVPSTSKSLSKTANLNNFNYKTRNLYLKHKIKTLVMRDLVYSFKLAINYHLCTR